MSESTEPKSSMGASMGGPKPADADTARARGRILYESSADDRLPDPRDRNKPLGMYLDFAERAAWMFTRLSARERASVADFPTIVSMVLCLVGFALWQIALGPIQLADLWPISSSYAQTPGEQFNPKPYIQAAIFCALFATLVLSVWVSFFGRNTKNINAASTTSKMLLVFFIGAATKFL